MCVYRLIYIYMCTYIYIYLSIYYTYIYIIWLYPHPATARAARRCPPPWHCLAPRPGAGGAGWNEAPGAGESPWKRSGPKIPGRCPPCYVCWCITPPIYIYIYIHTYGCVYIYIWVYIYFIYIYIYLFIQKNICLSKLQYFTNLH